LRLVFVLACAWLDDADAGSSFSQPFDQLAFAVDGLSGCRARRWYALETA